MTTSTAFLKESQSPVSPSFHLGLPLPPLTCITHIFFFYYFIIYLFGCIGPWLRPRIFTVEFKHSHRWHVDLSSLARDQAFLPCIGR